MHPEPTPLRADELRGLDAAYEFVRPSYEIVVRRLEVAEARARATMTFAGTLMFAAPAFVTATVGAGSRSFVSPWFLFGALAFVGVIACLVAQQLPHTGELKLISPRGLLDDGYLEDPPATFKYNVLLYSARNWDDNRAYINRLMNIATLGAVALGVQFASLALWVLLG